MVRGPGRSTAIPERDDRVADSGLLWLGHSTGLSRCLTRHPWPARGRRDPADQAGCAMMRKLLRCRGSQNRRPAYRLGSAVFSLLQVVTAGTPWLVCLRSTRSLGSPFLQAARNPMVDRVQSDRAERRRRRRGSGRVQARSRLRGGPLLRWFRLTTSDRPRTPGLLEKTVLSVYELSRCLSVHRTNFPRTRDHFCMPGSELIIFSCDIKSGN